MKEKSVFKTIYKSKVMFFFASQSITLFGSTLVQMAIIWYITLNMSSGAWIAAFTIASYLPQFLFSFFGGVLADRYSLKKLIISADMAIAAVTLVLILIISNIENNSTALYVLLVVSVIRSIASGIQTPAVNAVLPRLVESEFLMRCNGINATMQSVVQFAAPAAAGAVLSFFDLKTTLWIDIVTAVIGCGILIFVPIPKLIASNSKCKEKPHFIADIRLGFNYVFTSSILKNVIIVYGIFIFLSVPAGFLAQLFVSRTFGDTYWYLTAVELVGFLGMTLGGILISSLAWFKNSIITFAAGITAFGIFAIGMGFSKNFIFYLILMLFYGIALTVVQTASATIVQQNATRSMQGRVFGILNSMYSGFLPIGMAVFGPLSDLVQMNLIMIATGFLLLIISLFVYRFKASNAPN